MRVPTRKWDTGGRFLFLIVFLLCLSGLLPSGSWWTMCTLCRLNFPYSILPSILLYITLIYACFKPTIYWREACRMSDLQITNISFAFVNYYNLLFQILSKKEKKGCLYSKSQTFLNSYMTWVLDLLYTVKLVFVFLPIVIVDIRQSLLITF